jgi:hypothetical protein
MRWIFLLSVVLSACMCHAINTTHTTPTPAADWNMSGALVIGLLMAAATCVALVVVVIQWRYNCLGIGNGGAEKKKSDCITIFRIPQQK